MEIFKTKKTLLDYIERQKEMGKKIGFAPTMGALHQGHISLYAAARKDIFEDQRGMALEYFIIADEATLKETDFFYKDRNYRAFIVVNVGTVRLIDNMHLD